jgi:hypothetical protein
LVAAPLRSATFRLVVAFIGSCLVAVPLLEQPAVWLWHALVCQPLFGSYSFSTILSGCCLNLVSYHGVAFHLLMCSFLRVQLWLPSVIHAFGSVFSLCVGFLFGGCRSRPVACSGSCSYSFEQFSFGLFISFFSCSGGTRLGCFSLATSLLLFLI